MDVIRTEHPVAKKRHICMICGCPIERGTRYFFQVNTFDGLCTFKGHEECVKYELGIREPYDDEGSSPDYTEDWVHDDLTDILGTQKDAWKFRESHNLFECVQYIQEHKQNR